MRMRTGSTLLWIFIFAAMFLTLSLKANAGETVTARTIAERIDKSKYSSAEIKTYVKGLKGNSVTADGRVKDIMSGRTGNRVVLIVNAGRARDFIVDVYADDASKLHKNDKVSCKGQFARYNPFTLNGITLKDGSCSKK